MNKCQHCGTFVPVEKAFCPNCSEPMEPEETPNRAHSFSSDMLATIRDDPEKYRQMLMPPSKKPPASATPQPVSQPGPASVPPPVVSYSPPEPIPPPPPPVAVSEKNYLPVIIGVVVVLIVVFVILYAFKVI
jgi:hypothetical protein